MAHICFDEVKKAIGDRFSDQEIAGIIDIVDGKLLSKKKWRKNVNDHDELLRIINEVKQEKMQQSVINLANRVKKNKKVTEFLNYVDKNDLNLYDAFEARIGGQYKGRVGEANSYDVRFKSHQRQMNTGLITDLRKANLFKQAKKGNIGREITKELWELREGGRSGITGNTEAQEIAKILRKYMDHSIEIQNNAGSYINKIEGYQGKQYHDPAKLNRVKYERWKEDIIGKLDMEQTFGDADPEKYLRTAYDDILTGKVNNFEDPLMIRSMEGDVIRSATRKRKLIFKDADSYWDYNLQYGSGEDVLLNIASGINTAARNTAILEMFGPSPKAFMADVINHARINNRGDFEGRNLIRNKTAYLEQLMAVVDGSIFNVGNHMGAKVATGIRMTQSMSKLGGVALSQFPDLAFSANALSLAGTNYVTGLSKMIGGIVKGRRSGSRRAILDYIGVGAEGFEGALFQRLMPEDELTGKMSTMSNMFFKMTGMEWLNDVNKSSVGLILSNQLGKNRVNSWNKLKAGLKTELKRYNITKEKWELIRTTAKKADDNRYYVSPEDIKKIDLDTIKSTFDLKTTKQAERFRYDMEVELNGYFIGSVDDAILTPGVKDIARQTQGLQRGTMAGEAIRFIMQFKNFPIMAITRTFMRNIRTKGGVIPALPSLAMLFIASSTMGYVSMTAKDLVRGKKPKDPRKAWRESIMYGGALGIYGDFLFNAQSRYGASPISTMLGPTAATVDSVIKAYIEKPVEGKFEDIPYDSFKILKTNLPFNNLFYTRMLFDHFIMYGMQEALNPGYLNRLEKHAKGNYNQEYWLPPTEAVQF